MGYEGGGDLGAGASSSPASSRTSGLFIEVNGKCMCEKIAASLFLEGKEGMGVGDPLCSPTAAEGTVWGFV